MTRSLQSSISIAMAIYNGARFLREQLESICCQTLQPYEVVISDDGSSDASLSIADEFKDRLNIVLVSNKNRHGFVGNFEHAISLCRGDFIALCDQDDVWQDGKLERMIAAIGPHAMVHCDADVIDANGRRIAASWNAYFGKPIAQDFLQYLSGWNNVTGGSVLFKRELASKLLPIPLHMPYHDLWLALIAYRYGGIAVVAEPLMSYRLHGANAVGASEPRYPRKIGAEIKRAFFQDLLDNRERLRLSEDEAAHVEILLSFFLHKLDRRICFDNFPVAIKYYQWLYRNRRPMIVNLLLSMVGVNW